MISERHARPPGPAGAIAWALAALALASCSEAKSPDPDAQAPPPPAAGLPSPGVSSPGLPSTGQSAVVPLIASASVEKGASAARKCVACHTFEKGGPNRIGPNLYGVVGRERGKHPGFNFTAAMKGKGGTWSYEELDRFLLSPKLVVIGTNMAFAGIAEPADRADMIAYLRTLADTPVPLPAAP